MTKYKILNIRGPNGSGKSYIMLKLMKKTNAKPLYHEDEKNKLMGALIGYKGEYRGTPIYFVGPYDVMSGGADKVMKHFSIELVDDLVRKWSKLGHVIFEGFIIAGLYSRYSNLSKEVGGITFCYIDTPMEVCLQRLKDRNKGRSAAVGLVRKGMGNKTVGAKDKQIWVTKDKFTDDGEKIRMIDHEKPMKAIYRILKEK